MIAAKCEKCKEVACICLPRLIEKRQYLGFYDIDDKTIPEIIAYFLEIEKSFKKEGYDSPVLDISLWGDYDNSSAFVSRRKETEEEYEKRKWKEALRTAQIEKRTEEREKQLYEQLKKKYEATDNNKENK